MLRTPWAYTAALVRLGEKLHGYRERDSESFSGGSTCFVAGFNRITARLWAMFVMFASHGNFVVPETGSWLMADSPTSASELLNSCSRVNRSSIFDSLKVFLTEQIVGAVANLSSLHCAIILSEFGFDFFWQLPPSVVI
jgi:hypothetical protein